MNRKMIVGALVLIAALALYVAAQDNTGTKSLNLGLRRLQELELRVVTSAGEKPLPSWAGKMRIEMQDGTAQEIELKNVKKILAVAP
jgi:hypothetical protein